MAVAWWAALALLAAVTANPVTLNIGQMVASERVVLAEVVDWNQGEVRVLEAWRMPKGDALPVENVEIRQLAAAKPLTRAKQYLFPLRRVGPRVFQVTPLADPRMPPTAYPATGYVMGQWQQMRHQLAATAGE